MIRLSQVQKRPGMCLALSNTWHVLTVSILTGQAGKLTNSSSFVNLHTLSLFIWKTTEILNVQNYPVHLPHFLMC